MNTIACLVTVSVSFADYGRYIKFFEENQIDVCVFEWCSPFKRGKFVEGYFSSKKPGNSDILLPHGCNVFINNDVTVGYRRLARRGLIEDPLAAERRCFDYYILQNPIRRDGWVKWGLDPQKTQAWGSLRFCPEWSALNLSICPKFVEPVISGTKLKVVLMQFQKEYNIDNELIFAE